MNLKIRLALMNFLEFAVWGAYLTSMGRYLGNIGLGENIGWFYSMQGIVSIFMPALMGIRRTSPPVLQDCLRDSRLSPISPGTI